MQIFIRDLLLHQYRLQKQYESYWKLRCLDTPVMIPLVMFGWIPLVLYLFSRFQTRPRVAVIGGILFVYLFFPWYEYALPGPFNYNKLSAGAYGILLGTAIFQPQAFKRFQWHPLDLPISVWCLVPLFTSLSNGLGVYDGVSAAIGRLTMWGAPYYLGRIYFNSREALEDLALGFFLGSLLYVPFCWYEIVMSPRLHRLVYGFHPHSFSQAKRGGGWRPVVFMQHGLMNSMWMVSGFLSGFTLLFSRLLGKRIQQFKALWPFLLHFLFVTILFLKSTGALFLMLLGIAAILATIKTRRPAFLLVLLMLPLLYAGTRATGIWDGQNLIDAAARIASTERTGSLEYRINNETILAEHAWTRPLLGWGEWGRSFVRSAEGEIISVPDGLWILAFGKSGFIGLAALQLVFFIPPLLFLKEFPPARWNDPPVTAILALPLLLTLFALDNLMNDMFNPLMMILAGAITGLHLHRDRQDSAYEPEFDLATPSFPRLL